MTSLDLISFMSALRDISTMESLQIVAKIKQMMLFVVQSSI